MAIGEICSREVVFVTRRESVATAARLMREHHVGCLVVAEARGADRVPVGMITDRDIAVGVVAMGLNPESIAVGDAMAPELVYVNESAGIAETVDLMRLKGVRRLPVVDANGALVGLIAADDMLLLLAEEISGLAGIVSRGPRRERALRTASA